MSFLADLSDSDDDQHDSSLFSHSARNFTSIIAEQARKKNEKVEAVLAEPERKTEPKKRAKRKSEDVEVDVDDDAALVLSATVKPVDKSESSRDALDDVVKPGQPIDTYSPRPSDGDLKAFPSSPPTVEYHASKTTIDLSDPAEPPLALVEEPPNDDSDDEFAEIAKRARLLARQKRVERAEKAAREQAQKAARPVENKSTEQEPKVEIFLSSQLPDTAPLRVFLRLSQHLGLVRSAWCQRQNFTPEQQQQVYLTYRQRRIYDASTCRSLGLEVDIHGRLVLRGAEDKHGIDKVHLEAVTDDLLEQLRTQQRTEARIPESTSYEIQEHDRTLTNEKPAASEEQLIRIILKARDHADFKLRIRPTTTIAKIASAYKKRYKLDDDLTITLLFDGEELPSEQEVQETEVTDMDQIEVHFR
ncbi:hypothetical protein AMS68_005641 [Peltaster fructicola]|uniref:Ubiquitin-like domain-containing protein n=1 Tax=Peltaster fructicola TaxID=286661 RepID=A0A6H0XZD8_9PEZI|nr:hypothetical protein AMS68_005641 [Peltaster fructicola]